MTNTRRTVSDEPNPNIERFKAAAKEAGVDLDKYDPNLVGRFCVEGRSPSDLPEAKQDADGFTFE